MVSRIAAFVTWAAVAASIVFWALRLWAQPIDAPAHATVVSAAAGFKGDLSRLFGVDAPAPAVTTAPVRADSRFRLIGVVAPRGATAPAQGLALIATDGKPAKAFRVGAAVDGELLLLAVHARGASLGPRGQPAQVVLELPALPPPSSGTLPAAGSSGPMNRPALTLPARPMPPQGGAAPPAPTGSAESEPQSDAADRPMTLPPAGGGRPPA
jgi:general secretion pathway protein C